MENAVSNTRATHAFDACDQRAIYDAILSRRDVRGQFLPDDVPSDILSRLLIAAHHAPSVGFMQPWTFMVIRSREVRGRVKRLFDEANLEASEKFEGKKQTKYRDLKLEGILDAPLNLCITCDRDRAGPVILGRTHIPEMDLYSTVCAVQNFWLAARAEGVGVGWVSIVDERKLAAELGLPESVVPIAYLCVGYVREFLDKPELEKTGWRDRLSLEDLVVFDHWDGPPNDTRGTDLRKQVGEDQDAVLDGRFLDQWKSRGG